MQGEMAGFSLAVLFLLSFMSQPSLSSQDSPYRLRQWLRGFLRDEDMTGKSVVSRVLGDEPKISEGKESGCDWTSRHRYPSISQVYPTLNHRDLGPETPLINPGGHPRVTPQSKSRAAALVRKEREALQIGALRKLHLSFLPLGSRKAAKPCC